MPSETVGWDETMPFPCRKCKHYAVGAPRYRSCVMHRDEWDDRYWEYLAPWNRRRYRQAWTFEWLDEIEAWCNRELDWIRNSRVKAILDTRSVS